MLPADEPLGGDRAAEPELDLRLVVEHQLVVGERAAQVGGEHEPLGAVVVVLCAVGHERVVARLGAVHRDVRALEQRVDVGAVIGIPGQADAGVELEADSVDLEGRCRASWRRCTAAWAASHVGARHENGEFVAAEARDEILAAERRPQPGADLLEHEVTVMVTQRVVDLLEAVEVDEQEPAGAERLVLQRLPDGLEEPAPVRQLGEAVVAGEVLGGRRCGRSGGR